MGIFKELITMKTSELFLFTRIYRQLTQVYVNEINIEFVGAIRLLNCIHKQTKMAVMIV